MSEPGIMFDPRTLAERVEEGPSLPSGDRERFGGYGIMGLPFASGHILGLRRFTASSVGPAYTSVWYRSPDGRWTFYQDVEPHHACPRYFGTAIHQALVRPVDVRWTGSHTFEVTIGADVGLRWRVSLIATAASRLMTAFSGILPDRAWNSGALMKAAAAAAGLVLGAGRIGLAGLAPNGQSFAAIPKYIWIVDASTALLGGRDLGPIGPLPVQARIGDFWIPQRGLFAVGGTMFDVYDAALHSASTDLAGLQRPGMQHQ